MFMYVILYDFMVCGRGWGVGGYQPQDPGEAGWDTSLEEEGWSLTCQSLLSLMPALLLLGMERTWGGIGTLGWSQRRANHPVACRLWASVSSFVKWARTHPAYIIGSPPGHEEAVPWPFPRWWGREGGWHVVVWCWLGVVGVPAAPHQRPLSPPDPPDQLRLHSPRPERQQPLRLLLPSGALGHVPGPGHGGHRPCPQVELRVHAGLGGQLRRERRGGLHPEVPGGR